MKHIITDIHCEGFELLPEAWLAMWCVTQICVYTAPVVARNFALGILETKTSGTFYAALSSSQCVAQWIHKGMLQLCQSVAS
jgi:hypothetical protein